MVKSNKAPTFPPQVGSESSEFASERGTGRFVQYDTLQTDPQYVDLESRSPPREESARSSPVSMGTGSIGGIEFFHVFVLDSFYFLY